MQAAQFPHEMFNRWKPCRHGTILYNVNHIYIGRSLDLYGEDSEGEAALFQSILRSGDVVVEAGANIGAHTVVLSRAVGNNGLVMAFEPQRLIFQSLCANAALNSLANIYCFEIALSAQPGTIEIPVLDPYQANNFGGLALEEGPRNAAIAVTTIDALGISNCRFIKIDVEGMEMQVLKGAADTIARCRPALYVECDRPERSTALLEYMKSRDYLSHIHCPPLFNAPDFFQNPVNVFGDVVSKNLLCLHRNDTLAVQNLPRVA